MVGKPESKKLTARKNLHKLANNLDALLLTELKNLKDYKNIEMNSYAFGIGMNNPPSTFGTYLVKQRFFGLLDPAKIIDISANMINFEGYDNRLYVKIDVYKKQYLRFAKLLEEKVRAEIIKDVTLDICI